MPIRDSSPIDEQGQFKPELIYAYTFNGNEIKSPLITMYLITYFILSLPNAVIGLLAGAFVSNLCVRWLRIASGQGRILSYQIVWGFLGAIIGLVAGLVAAGMIRPQTTSGYWRTASLAAAAVLVLALAVIAFCRVFAHIPPKIDGRELTLQLELRVPTGLDQTPQFLLKELYVDFLVMVPWGLATADRVKLDPAKARHEGSRLVIPGSIPVITSRGRRVFTFNAKGKPLWEELEIPLPPHPGREQLEWSGWWPATTESGQPWPETKLSCRFRVTKIEQEVTAAKKTKPDMDEFAESKAALDAIPADAPITVLLEFTSFGRPEGIKLLAIDRIAANEHMPRK